MSIDDIKKRFVNEIKLRAYDDKYIDKNEEREILQIAIQLGVSDRQRPRRPRPGLRRERLRPGERHPQADQGSGRDRGRRRRQGRSEGVRH